MTCLTGGRIQYFSYDLDHIGLQECGRKITEPDEVATAVSALLPEAKKLWVPIEHWGVRRVRSGVRALPPRTDAGAMPVAGKLAGDNR